MFLLYLSHLEHLRSLRPSTVICLFVGLTLVFDLPRIRTLSFMPDNRPVTIVFATSWVGKAIILVLESTEKRSLLKKAYEGSSLESTANTFSRSLFWWLNGLLWEGSRSTLTVDSLPVLDEAIKAASNPEKLTEAWDKGQVLSRKGNCLSKHITDSHRPLADKYRPNALLWTLAWHYRWEIIEGVLPRIAFLGFSFAQPFLVERVLSFMTESEHVNSTNYARSLVAAYAIVYIGLAVRAVLL